MPVRLALVVVLSWSPISSFDGHPTPALGVQPASTEASAIQGLVHETRPSMSTVLANVRVEVVGGELNGRIYTTAADGRFSLPPVASAGFALQFTKPGYEVARVDVQQTSGALEVALRPEPSQVTLTRSGANACTDLPQPPDGVPGRREYARIAVHHDGQLVVRAAQLPFFGNQGYLYRRTENGWERNELDYILVRTPLPVLGGFEYVITFGGDKELCGPWSLDATHPR
jgi:hypothetical protein